MSSFKEHVDCVIPPLRMDKKSELQQKGGAPPTQHGDSEWVGFD